MYRLIKMKKHLILFLIPLLFFGCSKDEIGYLSIPKFLQGSWISYPNVELTNGEMGSSFEYIFTENNFIEKLYFGDYKVKPSSQQIWDFAEEFSGEDYYITEERDRNDVQSYYVEFESKSGEGLGYILKRGFIKGYRVSIEGELVDAIFLDYPGVAGAYLLRK
tara:strand:+ start:3310 stop:3798 length:489 start_codon:yes stop_codon:yes gene_type:complete